jgi:hypothetical protein
MTLRLTILPGEFAVCRLEPDAEEPALAPGTSFMSVTRTARELSIVCAAELAPDHARIEPGWACLQVAGPLDFGLTGILAAIATPLAVAEISIFAVSTFDTDYVLVKHARLEVAVRALQRAGMIVE